MSSIHTYFTLQWTMFKRQLIEFGLNPILAIFIILCGFFSFSFILFNKTEYASYLYVLIALAVIMPFSELNRNDFLKFTYPRTEYLRLRLLENLISSVPFFLFLCFNQFYLLGALLLVVSILFVFLNASKIVTPSIPTPFYRKPFEFIVGFRRSLFGFLFAYFLTLMSILYQNFNLGIFSLAITFLICLSFYSDPESEFYVWVHSQKTKVFLLDKIMTAFGFSTIILLPILISLIVYFPENLKAIIGIQLLGYLYLLTIILAKYANFPTKLSLPQGILLALSVTMPPLLLIIIPYFYKQSHKRLKLILE